MMRFNHIGRMMPILAMVMLVVLFTRGRPLRMAIPPARDRNGGRCSGREAGGTNPN